MLSLTWALKYSVKSHSRNPPRHPRVDPEFGEPKLDKFVIPVAVGGFPEAKLKTAAAHLPMPARMAACSAKAYIPLTKEGC